MSEKKGSAFRPPSEWRIVAILVVAAALLRLRTGVLRGDSLSFDESMYVILGRNLLAGHGYVMNDLPNATFPFLLSLIAGLGDLAAGPRWALMLPTIIFGAAALVPLYLLARRMAGQTAAFAAALVYAGFPALLHFTPFVQYAQKLYEGGEHVYIFFFLFAAYFAYAAAETGRRRDYILAGLFTGAAFEVRQEAVLFAAAAIAWLAGVAAARRRWRDLARVGECAAAALLLALPFVVQARVVTGAWYSGPRFSKTFLMRDDLGSVVRRNIWKNALASYFRLNAEGTDLETAYYGVSPWHKRRIAEGHERAGLGEVVKGLRLHNIRTARMNFRRTVIPPFYGAPLALGVIALLMRPGRLRTFTFFAALAFPAAFIAAALYPLTRFSMYLAPLAPLLMGIGIAFVFETAFSRSRRLAPWAASAAFAVAAAFAVHGAWRSIKSQDALRKEPSFARTAESLHDYAADWLERNTAPGERVVASSPQAPLFAGREWIAMPIDTGERVLAYARYRGVRYMVQMTAGTEKPPEALQGALVAIYSGQAPNVSRQHLHLRPLSAGNAGPFRGDTENMTVAWEKRLPRTDILIVAAIAAGAAAARLAAGSLRGDYLSFDESMYVILGRNLLAGHGYLMNDLPNATFPPLISLIAGASDMALGPRWALTLPSALLGGAAALPLFLLARRMASRTVAFAAALLYAGFPSLLQFTPFVSYPRRLYDGSEQVYLFFFLFAAWFVYAAARDGRLRYYIAAGLFAGAAFEVRQDAALFAGVATLWLAAIAVARREWRRLPRIAGFAAVALLLALPYLVQVRVATGSWGAGPRFAKTFSMRDTFTPVLAENRWEDALASYFALNDEGTELETAYWGVSARHRARTPEGREAARTLDVLAALRPRNVAAAQRAFLRFVVPDKLGYAMLLGLAALILAPWRWTNFTFLVALALPGVFAVAALFPLLRFVMYLAPFAALVAAWGIVALFELAAFVMPRFKDSAAPVALLATAALALYGTYSGIRSQAALRAERSYERVAEDLETMAAGWLSANTAPGARVMASSPQTPLRARRLWLALPIARPARVIEYARRREADFIVETSSGGGEPDALMAPALVAAFADQARGVAVKIAIYDLSTLPVAGAGGGLP